MQYKNCNYKRSVFSFLSITSCGMGPWRLINNQEAIVKNSRVASATRKRFIHQLNRIRRRLEQTQEGILLGSAVSALRDQRDSEATQYLSGCLNSPNLMLGETQEIKIIIGCLSSNKLKSFLKMVFPWTLKACGWILECTLKALFRELFPSNCDYLNGYTYYNSRPRGTIGSV